MVKISILDGYIDEPTCLGVPPYISPYPRYIAGAIWDFDKKINISYFTIDQIRKERSLIEVLSSSDIVIVIAGMSVPGKYLSGYPVSPYELVTILERQTKPMKLLCGPAARYGFGLSGGKKTIDTKYVDNVFDAKIKGDCEIVLTSILHSNYDFEKEDLDKCREKADEIRNYAILGSKIVSQHPFFPNYLIAEIETYRGCPRSIVGGCSFCSEPSKGLPDFRQIKDIVDEVQSLYKTGVRHFRIGNQPCIFSYMAKDAGKKEFPKPNPLAVESLFKGIRSVAPDCKTLHIDNANPGVISRYPKESRLIVKSIVKYHTPGDVAAFGVESVDPFVIKKNNLKANEEEIYSAIKLINEIGRNIGLNGMPELLPGLNFVFGLEGETRKTFDLDFNFLKKILNNGLLIRRINLRQIIPIPGTKMYPEAMKIVNKNKKYFKKFKRKVKDEIEHQMLKKVIPKDTVLTDVYSEIYKGKTTFGRQMGSYPILVGIPGNIDLEKFFNVKVIGHGYRSITALIHPIDINNADRVTIENIPGVGPKRARRILLNRPFKSKDEFISSLDDPNVGKDILKFLSFEKH